MPEAPKTKDRVIADLTIAAPVEAVWAAVRDPAQIERWFGWDAASLKDEVEYIFVTHADVDEAGRVIAFQGTSDRFEVTPVDGGARLRVIRAAPADDADWDDVYEEMTEGWICFVEQLRLALEAHALAPRRTLYFSGKAVAAGTVLPVAALGLAGLRSAAPGAVFTADLPSGRVEGTAWHASPHQVGLRAPAFGDGLLVAVDRPIEPDRPHGGGWIVLTTYGLDDDAFAALERTWADWWKARYPG